MLTIGTDPHALRFYTDHAQARPAPRREGEVGREGRTMVAAWTTRSKSACMHARNQQGGSSCVELNLGGPVGTTMFRQPPSIPHSSEFAVFPRYISGAGRFPTSRGQCEKKRKTRRGVLKAEHCAHRLGSTLEEKNVWCRQDLIFSRKRCQAPENRRPKKIWER